MPITEEDIEASAAPIAYARPGTARVLVGPCTSQSWTGEVILLDGRHYVCAGRVTFADGTETRAQIHVRTHEFEFLEGADCYVAGAWYDVNEPELYVALGIDREAARPFTWATDVPLDGEPGPHSEEWFDPAL